MAEADERKMSLDVIVYMGYLVAFLALLYFSVALFGDNLLTLAFGAFIVAVIGIIAVASRTLLA